MAARTAREASHEIIARSPSGIAVSRIARTTNGGTSASRAAARMATRNRAIVPRYGRANDQIRRSVARDSWAPSIGRGSRGHVGRTHAHASRLRSQLGGSVPYDAPPWRDLPGRDSERCSACSSWPPQRAAPTAACPPIAPSREPAATDALRPGRPPPTRRPPPQTPRPRSPAHRQRRIRHRRRRLTPRRPRWTGRSTARARRPRCSRSRSTTTTPTARRSSCTSPGASPTTRRTRSGRCS